MIDIEDLTHQYIEDSLEHLEDFHIPLHKAINHDTLYELCSAKAIDDLAAETEAKAEEIKLKGVLYE